jgi:hypothetical protein
MSQKPVAAPVPLLLGELNAEAVVGRSWRWVKDTANALGVPVYRHRLVDAERFLAALRAEAESSDGGPANDEQSGTDRVLALVGRRLVG